MTKLTCKHCEQEEIKSKTHPIAICYPDGYEIISETAYCEFHGILGYDGYFLGDKKQ